MYITFFVFQQTLQKLLDDPNESTKNVSLKKKSIYL